MTLPRGVLAALLAAAVLAALPAAAAAHSELASSSPARGEILAAAPAVITGEFTAPVDAARSSMELRGPDGATIARGGVPEGGPPTRMTIAGVPPLAPGRYTVRWTTVTPDDDGVERGTFRFTVAAATPAPPTAAPTPTPAATLGATPGSAPTPGAIPAATPTEAPAPTGAPDQMPTAPGAADVLIPLVVLAVVLGGGVAWAVRRRR